MGRKKLNRSPEELRKESNEKRMRYYHKNLVIERKRSKQYYHERRDRQGLSKQEAKDVFGEFFGENS